MDSPLKHFADLRAPFAPAPATALRSFMPELGGGKVEDPPPERIVQYEAVRGVDEG